MKKRDYLKIIAERAQTADYTSIRQGVSLSAGARCCAAKRGGLVAKTD